MSATEAAEQVFDCPRCHQSVTERFWGPCGRCRTELNAAYRKDGAGEGSESEPSATRFEPAMHVVPNHVATKD